MNTNSSGKIVTPHPPYLLFLFMLPKHQTSDLNTLPWRALIIRGLNRGVRHPPRTPIELRIKILDQKRLVRRHATSIVPSVLRARSQMPLLIVLVDGVGRLADDNPGRDWPELVFFHASGIAHRQWLAVDCFQRLPHVDDTPPLSGERSELVRLGQSVEHDFGPIIGLI